MLSYMGLQMIGTEIHAQELCTGQIVLSLNISMTAGERHMGLFAASWLVVVLVRANCEDLNCCFWLVRLVHVCAPDSCHPDHQCTYGGDRGNDADNSDERDTQWQGQDYYPCGDYY
ncbi:hypothetical protein SAMN04489740_4009 [Arthrobacter alpinus]|uniref:Uncharacterized protein n=1 Tax=Arthrobacter alpinus TaxID=656366 RepID=A0A1H5P9M5_9MICC|nr:hypothetical protein SAMN04489740_4009 [Arthrobacter alpinus]